MGSVEAYTTTNGRRYRARWRDPDHVQRERRGFATKRDAELYVAAHEIRMATGTYIDPSAARVQLANLGPAWLRSQSHLKASSARPLEIVWRLYVAPRWGQLRVDQIRFSDVQAWVSELALAKSPTTVIRAYGVLASILDVAVKDRRLDMNPIRGIKLPRKSSKEHVYLTHQQVHELAMAAGTNGALVLLLAYTGLRWGEATGLRVGDVDTAHRRINVTVNAVEVGATIVVGTPKNHKRRTVPYPAFLSGAIAFQVDGKDRRDLLFASPTGDFVRRPTRGNGTWFKSALIRAGLPPMTIHDLRHTAASLSVSSGANVKAVQRMLGHASAAMTLDVYSDLFDDDLDAVAEQLDRAASLSVVGKSWAPEPIRSR